MAFLRWKKEYPHPLRKWKRGWLVFRDMISSCLLSSPSDKKQFFAQNVPSDHFNSSNDHKKWNPYAPIEKGK